MSDDVLSASEAEELLFRESQKLRKKLDDIDPRVEWVLVFALRRDEENVSYDVSANCHCSCCAQDHLEQAGQMLREHDHEHEHNSKPLCLS